MANMTITFSGALLSLIGFATSSLHDIGLLAVYTNVKTCSTGTLLYSYDSSFSSLWNHYQMDNFIL